MTAADWVALTAAVVSLIVAVLNAVTAKTAERSMTSANGVNLKSLEIVETSSVQMAESLKKTQKLLSQRLEMLETVSQDTNTVVNRIDSRLGSSSGK